MIPTTGALRSPDATAAWSVVDRWTSLMQQWLGQDWRPQAITWLVTKPLALLVLVVVALAARWFLHRLIDQIVRRAAEGLPNPVLAGPSLWLHRGEEEDAPASTTARTGTTASTGSTTASTGSTAISTEAEPPPLLGSGRRVQRAETMGSLLKSVTSVVIVTVFVITAIAELGYPVGPLLASAGVVGVALGFGAQSLVKDFLSGIFMIFEDQYGVGDVVDLGEATGTVEAVGLRVSRLRDVQGTVWYVRNGEILRVGNQSQNWARTVLDIPVALDQDLHRVQDVLREVAHDLWDDEDFAPLIIEEPEVWGVQELTPNWVVVRVTMKTAPLEQWAVAREMRQRVKIRFDHEGIELAHPTVAPWTG